MSEPHRCTITDGVMLGIGMFIVLPVLLVVLSFAVAFVVAVLSGAPYPGTTALALLLHAVARARLFLTR